MLVKCSANVDVIPAHIDLVAIEIELVDKENRIHA
jgi:cellulose biosynthesis protein BcsQ